MEDHSGSEDICRVCRSEATVDRPLFYPCVCTGSIKYIHQDCLTQWLRYSRKEYCELCNHRFSFTPIYAPDMPKRLPVRDLIHGLLSSVGTAFRFWFHYTLVAFAWLGVVPLSACRIHRSLFSGSFTSILSLPFDLVSTENVIIDILHGCIVVMCALSVFISLVWLRENIAHGGGPEWLADPPVENNNDGVEVVEENVMMNDEDVANENEADGDDNENGAVEGEALVAPAAPPPQNNNNNRRQRNNDDNNWPAEWDRGGEELTWEKLLGLDGSLLFIEHVFWVVSLNTLCMLVFEFSPYHIGYFTLVAIGAEDVTQYTHFEGLLTTLVGYLVVGFALVLLHGVATFFKLSRTRKFLGISYVVVKVCLLCVGEIGVFPLLCGWWLDVCSLPLFDASFKDRHASFAKAPGTSMFMHWLFGMVFVFYFASFVLLLREVLRPGVLWFLRNLNDPDFNPVQEMIQLPLTKHVRRFLFSAIVFGTTTVLMVWIPIRIIKRVSNGFLPYNFTFTTESNHEMSLELVLLQVMMPALLEQGHSREWMKYLVRVWCVCASWILDLRSYLLGDTNSTNTEADTAPPLLQENAENIGEGGEAGVREDDEEGDDEDFNDALGAPQGIVPPPPPAPVLAHPAQQVREAGDVDDVEPGGFGFVLGGGLGAAHQALILRDSPTEFLPYQSPKWFHLRICVLILMISVTLSVVSLTALTIPVSIGRSVLGYWFRSKGEAVHELYTTATGLYLTWMGVRCLILFSSWFPKGWTVLWTTFKTWSLTIIKSLIAMTVLMGVIPLLTGRLIELVLITPIRIPLTLTPVHITSENWVMGTLYVKILCASCMMFPPNFWLRRTLERVYNNGIRNINLKLILIELALPCIVGLGLALSIPYVIAVSIVPLFVTNLDLLNLVERRIYPLILVIALAYGIIVFQIHQFKKLYEHIKNDKYLVGRKLVNYERPLSNTLQSPSLAAIAQIEEL